MNSREYQYVLAVAEERSFTKAARRLIIAQPSLSIYISKLEQKLGHELFDRSATPLRLTPAGEAYIETARKILDLEAQTEKRLRDMSDEQYGRLIVGATAHRSKCILPEAVKQFCYKYPKFELILRELKNEYMMKLIDSGELDLGLTLGPVDESKYNFVVILKDEEMLLAVPKQHPISKELTIIEPEAGRTYPTVDLTELRDMPFVLVGEGHYTRSLVHDLCWREGFRPRIAVECGSAEMCSALVAVGAGVTILPASSLEFAGGGQDIIVFSLKQDYERRSVIAIYRKKSYLSNAAQDFLDILQGKRYVQIP